jgi:CHAD domain-containing protein
MPFHFKKKESVANAVRRLCCERLDDALEALERGAIFQAVHGVRKEIKKLRSVLRLTRGEIGRKTYRKNTDALREAANLLTAFRDAQVKLAAFDELMKYSRRKLPAHPFPEIKTALQENCRAEEKRLGRSIKPLRGILRESKRELDHLKIESKGWKAIAPGLKKIYGDGQNAFAIARRKSSDENFHEWRKRVKDLWQQLRLLRPARPAKLRDRVKNLAQLGALLGDEHDLFMLKEFAPDKFLKAQDAEALDKLIRSRQKELRSAALKLGARFYREKPGYFCRRIADYWKSWRSGA